MLRTIPHVPTTRERWDTPDDDFLDVDRLAAAPGAPILIVLHGLEGSSRSLPVRGLLHAAHQRGWGGLAVNFRSCSGTPNRQRRSYHAGETSDLAWVIQRMTAQHPDSPLLCAGFSLGGNVLLKYLGEQGTAAPDSVRAAVAISTPFDLEASVHALESKSSRTYARRLMRSLHRKTRLKLRRYPDLVKIVDPAALAAADTLAAFDDVVTAPAHGFANARDYWAACSSGQFLARIRRPTLLINAQDDPFLPASALPTPEVIAANPMLTAEFPPAGGHAGFIAGIWPWRPIPWAESRALGFLRGIMGVEEVSAMGSLPTITKEELKQKLDRREPVQVVNVLSPKSYELGIIKGSKKIPLAELDQRLGELDKSTEVVTYCANYNCSASKEAATKLLVRGYQVRAYEGGIEEWKQAGYPTE